MKAIERYLRMHGIRPKIPSACHATTRMICVIPCLNEPGIATMVQNLHRCLPQAAEILVVVNHPLNASAEVRQTNAQSINMLQADGIAHVLPALDLPPRRCGVGIARKLGMDEAMLRLANAGHADGLIVSLDADCIVDQHYGQELFAWADAHPQQHALLCEFWHRLDDSTSSSQRQAIIDYELFLRCITLGWQYAGLPYAFTAIGSCMVVRANAYARHSGMNQRQAGEDFYFMHKLARERSVAVLPHVRVYPSPRFSSRTPFGTGQAVRAWCEGESTHRYIAAITVFEQLRNMVDCLPHLFGLSTDDWLTRLDDELAMFLQTQGISKAVTAMKRNARTAESFSRHFYTWFDGLKAWRFIHSCSEQHGQPLHEVAMAFLRLHNINTQAEGEQLLNHIRQLQAHIYSQTAS